MEWTQNLGIWYLTSEQNTVAAINHYAIDRKDNLVIFGETKEQIEEACAGFERFKKFGDPRPNPFRIYKDSYQNSNFHIYKNNTYYQLLKKEELPMLRKAIEEAEKTL